MLERQVKGSLFVDYVRMIRSHKSVDWLRYLRHEDLAFLDQTIAADAWYPMDVFERLGIGILHEIAKGQKDAVRMWGYFQVDALQELHPSLITPGDPCESMRRFEVLRNGFFNFEALQVVAVSENTAHVRVAYHMSAVAEEAASWQTLGFFERLVTLAGGENVFAELTEKSWAGDLRTTIELAWRPPDRL